MKLCVCAVNEHADMTQDECVFRIYISFRVYGCVYIVPIAAGFQRGILETSTEEVTL